MPSFPVGFKNFNPTPALVKHFKKALDRLIELAPYDSHVKTTLEEKAGGYECEISINSTQKRWSVLKASAAPAEALMEAMGSVLNDLTSWKKNRFK